MIELTNRIAQNIRARKLFRRGERILVAVSGGLDSMVLLNILHALASQYKWQLTIAHLNHQLRGRSSNADEALVRKVGKRLKLPVVVGRAEVRRTAKQQRLSIEMAARKARHDFLAGTAARLKIRKVALAHHADDQLELFFLRLLRGSGSEGLAGMKSRGPSPSDHGIELVRPLLGEAKTALGEHAETARIDFHEDATNANLDFQRNRIRHELLPLLQKRYQPALDRTIARLADIIRAEAQLVDEMADEWLRSRKLFGRASSFDKLPVAMQRRCVRAQLIQRGITPDFDLIEELRSVSDHPVTIGSAKGEGDVQTSVVRAPSGLISVQKSGSVTFREGSRELGLKGRGRCRFGGALLAWKTVARQPAFGMRAKKGEEFFDAEKIGSKVTLRHWQPGDRFQPIGMASGVKLQDFFVNQKIPREKRHNLILGVASKGEVFWVEGLRISDRFKLTDRTIRCLQWRWKRL